MNASIPNDMLTWLNEQLAKAEQALRAREQMAEVNELDLDKLAEEWAKMPGVIVTKAKRGGQTKEDRAALAKKHRRIAEKNRRDVFMFKTLIGALS